MMTDDEFRDLYDRLELAVRYADNISLGDLAELVHECQRARANERHLIAVVAQMGERLTKAQDHAAQIANSHTCRCGHTTAGHRNTRPAACLAPGCHCPSLRLAGI